MNRGGYRGRGGAGGGRGGGRDGGGRGGGRDGGGRGGGGRDGGGRDGGGRGGGRDGGGRGGGGRDGRGRGGAGGRRNQQQQQQQQQRHDQPSQGQWRPPSGQVWGGATWSQPQPQPQPQPLSQLPMQAASAPVQAAASAGGGGRGRGAWGPSGGGGFSYMAAATASTPSAAAVRAPPPVTARAPVPVEALPGPSKHLASSSSPKETADKMVPIRRPDKGGVVAVRRVNLLVNHFRVKFNAECIIKHYDVDVKSDAPTKNGRQVKVTKADLSIIRNKLFSDNPSDFPLSRTAYDGEKNIFSAVDLPTGVFKVEFPEEEGMKCGSYTFTIKLVNELKLGKLKDYLTGNLFSIPRDILQGMDVVMKEHPTRCMVSVGRGFYSSEVQRRDDDFGFGVFASRGYQHSLKATAQDLALCLDYSVLALRKRLSVIDYLKEFINGFDPREFRKYRGEVEYALTKLKVTVTHRKTKQKFTIVGLSELDTKKIEFDQEDPEGKEPARRVSLIDYFRDKWGKEITYKDIPCLDLGKNNRKNYVPMEFCELVEGQIYPKEDLDDDSALWLKKLSLTNPRDRKNNISEMVRSPKGPLGGDVIRNFGLEVDMNMTSVQGRVLQAPMLMLGDKGRMINVAPDQDKHQWNLVNRGVTRGIEVSCWGVLDFSAYERNRVEEQFVSRLMQRCQSVGMQMNEPIVYEQVRMNKFSNSNELEALLLGVSDKAVRESRGQHLQLLLCVMSHRDPGYNSLKWIAETKLGLVTQCCLSGAANRRGDQYRANLALKINAKLGGSNVELTKSFPFFKAGDHVMFIGADVNHPAARNKTSPSIAAIVGTMNWPAANRYAARVHAQYHRKENIVDFGNMCLELVEAHARLNGSRPKKIVIFRDGVSEGQFDMVLNQELLDLKVTFSNIGYSPSITLIVAQKRHQTRFFPEKESDGGRTGNVPPGTVVDTKIIHPFEFDFYLCSHYGSIGTSKPTHYYCLWDEHGFSSDELQKLIFEMCFTFARCTKPVSLVPPVYYADLVAYRGRLYHEAIMQGKSQTQHRSRASSSSSSVAALLSSLSLEEASLDERFYKLHADLQDVMFFV